MEYSPINIKNSYIVGQVFENSKGFRLSYTYKKKESNLGYLIFLIRNVEHLSRKTSSLSD